MNRVWNMGTHSLRIPREKEGNGVKKIYSRMRKNISLKSHKWMLDLTLHKLPERTPDEP
jgi:hypothetical protein